MGGARQTADSARAAVGDALAKGRRRARRESSWPRGGRARPDGDAARRGQLGRQRSDGCADEVPRDQARSDLDAGMREARKEEPDIETLEKGLKTAKGLGISVDLEGIRPPPSALAVTTTGFGPGSVAAKKPVPPQEADPGQESAGEGGGEGRQAGRRWPRCRTTGPGDQWWPGAGAGAGRPVRRPAPPAPGQATRCGAWQRPGVRQCHEEREDLREGEAGPPAGSVEGEGGAGRGRGASDPPSSAGTMPSSAVSAHSPFSRASALPGVVPPRCSLGFCGPCSWSLPAMVVLAVVATGSQRLYPWTGWATLSGRGRCRSRRRARRRRRSPASSGTSTAAR